MTFSLPLILLLIQYCPWYIPSVPVFILPTTEYEVLVEEINPDLKETLGFAYFKNGVVKQEDCKIVLKDTAHLEVICHEYKHCVVGLWHD